MKVWKVIRNVLIGLIGLVLVLLVALQILLRPSVLTGIVNNVAAGLVEGDVAFREVHAAKRVMQHSTVRTLFIHNRLQQR